MSNLGALVVHGLFEHKGRHKGNVEWLSGRANRLKSNASAEELEKIVAHMKKK